MASPFKIFRKNQKAMLAIFGALLIVSWLVLQQLPSLTGTSRAEPNPDIVETRYGTLSERDLAGMFYRRNLANHFIASVRSRAQLAAPEAYFGRPTDQGVVQTMIFARKAEALGMSMPNEQIVAILDEFSQQRLTDEIFHEIAMAMRAPETEILDALRAEFLAMNFSAQMFPASVIATPAVRWANFQRLHRQVSLEVAPVVVETFVGKTPTPDEPTLRQFYDAYKDNTASPHSAIPGFRRPKRAQFQYFQAKLSDFATQVQVSDEEIAAAYERDKEFLYRYPVDSAMSNPFVRSGAAASDDVDVTPVVPPTAVEPAVVEPPSSEPAAEGVDATGASSTPTPENTPSPETTAPPAEEGQPPADKEDATAPQSSIRRPRFHLSSYRTQADAEETKPANDDAGVAEGNDTANANSDEAPPADSSEGNADDTVDTTTADATATPPASDSATTVDQEDANTVSTEWVMPSDLQSGPVPEFKPLWQVRDEVRLRIAEEKAGKQIDQALTELRGTLRRYEGQWRAWNTSPNKEDRPAPTPPDFAVLARKFGLAAFTTPLVSALELQELESIGFGNSFIGEFPNVTWVADVGYQRLQLFEPDQSQDVARNRYLFWKIEEEPERTPEFDEARAEVERAWKLEEARKLALEEAKSLQVKAEKAKESLRQVFAERKDLPVTETASFTWKRQSFVGEGQFVAVNSQVEGVDRAGDAFMSVAYALPVGGVGVAPNESGEIVYVMRLVGTQPELESLHTQFLTTSYASYADVGRAEAQQLQQRWYQEVFVDAEVNWLRPPSAEN